MLVPVLSLNSPRLHDEPCQDFCEKMEVEAEFSNG
jgi:hypothetical protein